MTSENDPARKPPAPADKFVRDVAKQIERRRTRRKLVLWGGLVAAIALAIMYGTCGHGWGLGAGTGKGAGVGPGSVKGLISADATPRRCAIRIAASGITVDAKPATREQAVVACKATTGADVLVAGDTKQADWDALETVLGTAGITIFRQQPAGGSGSAGSANR